MDWNTFFLELVNTFIALINVVIWPFVALVLLWFYREPLSEFVSGLGPRVTKLSAFDVSIELAQLPSPPSPWTDPNIRKSSEMRGGEVDSTAVKDLFVRIGADKPWDYLIVDVKDGRFWFVSRVFIFTVFLQAMRGLKCVVFVETSGEHRRRLLGVASPKAVRTEFVQAFPWLETALNNALSQYPQDCLGPGLSPEGAGNIIDAFIGVPRIMQLSCNPMLLLEKSESSQERDQEQHTEPIKPKEWQRLRNATSETWEHTYRLDLDIRRVSEAVTRALYERDSSRYVESLDAPNEEKIRALLFCTAPYVAVVNSQGEFTKLIDRQKLAVLVGETLIKE